MNEKIYVANNKEIVTYIEDPYPIQINEEGRRKIVFIFQSLGDENSDDEKVRYPYTLLKGVQYFNCRKKYIKDDKGWVGNYYLGMNGGFETSFAVTEFILSKIREYGVEMKDTISFGFSKGGYAALYYAYNIGLNTVVTGVPQFDLLNWVFKYKPHMKYIFPEDIETNEEKRNEYKDLLANHILSSTYRVEKVIVLTSHNDNTYSEHIPRLIETINKTSTKLKVIHNDEYFITRHNNVIVNSMNEIFYILSSCLIASKNIDLDI